MQGFVSLHVLGKEKKIIVSLIFFYVCYWRILEAPTFLFQENLWASEASQYREKGFGCDLCDLK